jgi:hypothetical protein
MIATLRKCLGGFHSLNLSAFSLSSLKEDALFLSFETAPYRDGLIWVSIAYLSNDTSGREQGG